MSSKQTSKNLINFISRAVSPYHAVSESIALLEDAGFSQLPLKGEWNIKRGEGYYISPFPTSLFAFRAGNDPQRFHIAAAHTDAPCLHVKPKAELTAKGYLRVNTEIYGGAILNTWLDRPLSIAGRVTLRSKDVFAPNYKMVNFTRPLLTIPNLAIHYNHGVNKGIELSAQGDMLPLLGIINDKLNEKDYFIDFLAKELKVKKEEILDFDLFVYNTEKGCFVGMNEEFVSSPRLDNLTSCLAAVNAIISGKNDKSVNVAALFDNEEIGSRTKQGADSTLLTYLLKKLYAAIGKSEAEFSDDILGSLLISADVAHALHPSKQDKYDPVNYALMNDGVVLKLSSSQRYSYDTEAVAILQQLLEKNNIKYKKFVNNSNVAGGTTLGPIISSVLPMRCVDVGVPILAMHSCRELMGTDDQTALENLLKAFFS